MLVLYDVVAMQSSQRRNNSVYKTHPASNVHCHGIPHTRSMNPTESLRHDSCRQYHSVADCTPLPCSYCRRLARTHHRIDHQGMSRFQSWKRRCVLLQANQRLLLHRCSCGTREKTRYHRRVERQHQRSRLGSPEGRCTDGGRLQ